MTQEQVITDSDIHIFCYKSMPVRTVDIDGETWCFAQDVCGILEIQDIDMALFYLVNDKEKGVCKIYTPSGEQDMSIVNRDGLKILLSFSDSIETTPFREWFTNTVLSSKFDTSPKCPPQIQTALADEIYKLASSAKNDGEFWVLTAMDKLHKRLTGKSALNDAGLSIVKQSHPDKIERTDDNLVYVTYCYHYALASSQQRKSDSHE